MPDEIEVPLDDAQEKVAELHAERHGAHTHEAHEKDGEAKEKEGWTRFVALTTALLAVVAAIGALQSGLLVNEALLQKNEQVSRLTEASDQWNYYQAEGLKSLIYKTAAQVLPPGSPTAQDDLSQSKSYKSKQDAIMTEAKKLEEQSKGAEKSASRYLASHHVFAFSVSLCQIAIALSAIAALTKKRRVWFFGLAAGLVGTILLLYGFLRH